MTDKERLIHDLEDAKALLLNKLDTSGSYKMSLYNGLAYMLISVVHHVDDYPVALYQMQATFPGVFRLLGLDRPKFSNQIRELLLDSIALALQRLEDDRNLTP